MSWMEHCATIQEVEEEGGVGGLGEEMRGQRGLLLAAEALPTMDWIYPLAAVVPCLR